MFGVESEQEVNFCCFKLPRFWSYYEGIILTCTREPVEIAEICFPTSKSFFLQRDLILPRTCLTVYILLPVYTNNPTYTVLGVVNSNK